jgi:hypothetical protein
LASDLAAASATVAAMILTSIPTVSISASAVTILATTQAIATRLATTALISHSERYCTREHNKSHQRKLSLHVAHPQQIHTKTTLDAQNHELFRPETIRRSKNKLQI